ncbi:hypothetical protein FRB91_004096 [Serendipita sp. 411]|nr:hypothetical protein FRC15_001944 [Serendipita sp. 397]KAG8787688.1 hypothetical protein FRC16_001514 [Serendipita sp. 398]KAG8807741.1 hypothetical protein FRC19_006359 [Serendipita sp. 401]KAG8826030.1 hypothetical protein FRC18_010147 [Serendipita sp. 400]KAG8854049.1 hypothetical protein FRB91_004096 [Serendipita sp. 411]
MENPFGPALNGITVGSWLNCMLYMLEIVLLFFYVRDYWPRDKVILKALVLTCFLVDTVCTIALCSWVFMSDVLHWGDSPYLARQYWPTPTYVICTSLVGALVQSFLVSRYLVLSKQRAISGTLFLFILTAFAGGVSVAVILISFNSYADRDKAIITATIWLVSSSVADVLIALCLVITLVKAANQTRIASTRNIINRLIVVSIQSGTFTTVLAILVLSIYLAKPSTNDSAYFSFCLGRAYTITMLFNLNLRRSIERTGEGVFNTFGVVSTQDHYGNVFDSGRASRARAVSSNSPGNLNPTSGKPDIYHLRGIRVHHAASVKVEKPNEGDVSLL